MLDFFSLYDEVSATPSRYPEYVDADGMINIVRIASASRVPLVQGAYYIDFNHIYTNFSNVRFYNGDDTMHMHFDVLGRQFSSGFFHCDFKNNQLYYDETPNSVFRFAWFWKCQMREVRLIGRPEALDFLQTTGDACYSFLQAFPDLRTQVEKCIWSGGVLPIGGETVIKDSRFSGNSLLFLEQQDSYGAVKESKLHLHRSRFESQLFPKLTNPYFSHCEFSHCQFAGIEGGAIIATSLQNCMWGAEDALWQSQSVPASPPAPHQVSCQRSKSRFEYDASHFALYGLFKGAEALRRHEQSVASVENSAVSRDMMIALSLAQSVLTVYMQLVSMYSLVAASQRILPAENSIDVLPKSLGRLLTAAFRQGRQQLSIKAP